MTDEYILNNKNKKNNMKRVSKILAALAFTATLAAQSGGGTQRKCLAGKGCDDMVEWDLFCTGGNN